MPSGRVNNKGVNKVIRSILNANNCSVLGFSKVLGSSERVTHKYLNNPYTMTIGQLYSLAGYTNTPIIELVAKLHYNRSKLSVQDKDNLSSIMARVSAENKEG